MTQDQAAPCGTGSTRSAPEAPSGLRPAGDDPSREVFAISSSACFYPEEDDPANFDGSMITWTFAAPKDTQTGAGIYRLQFVRILTADERGNPAAQVRALNAIRMEARQGRDRNGLDGEAATAGAEGIAKGEQP